MRYSGSSIWVLASASIYFEDEAASELAGIGATGHVLLENQIEAEDI